MAKANKKSKRSKKKSNNKANKPKLRSAVIVRAAERAHSAAGGIHADRRNKRKNRKSWRKELDDSISE